MASSFDAFLSELGRRHRVILIGGLAVIAHGLSRPTKDADVWLEPFESSDVWADHLAACVAAFPDATLYSLFDRREISAAELAGVIEKDRVIRVRGLSTDIDVFRVPNQIAADEFDAVWHDSEPWSGTVRVVDPLNLIVTKSDTGRDHDLTDIHFLEQRIRSSFGAKLEVASPAEARALLDRFADHVVLGHALRNPDEDVQAMALSLLREFAAAGDPFCADMLKERGEAA